MKISGNLVDLVHEDIFPATIEIEDGKIVAIEKTEKKKSHFLLPGFVDSHVHIESSMLPPSEFARFALAHGVIATVSDPHEIGNVLGIQGVEYMLENASLVPFKFYFGAPSCVPATDMETSGARIDAKEVEILLSKKEIKYLTEVMNFPGVIQKDPKMMAKIAIAKKLHKKIDGHAPGVKGEDLKKYIQAGITTDHECVSLEEAREKIALGMKILIREGSAARDFDTLFPLLLEDPTHCMLCTDDVDPEMLLHGGVDLLVKKAVAKGADLMGVLKAASFNPIRHYGLDVGLLQVGDPADFIEVDNLKDFHVLSTYVNGQCVYKNNKLLFERAIPKKINHFHTSPKQVSDFQIPAKTGNIHVIEAIDGQLLTKRRMEKPLVVDGFAVSDPKRDLLKIAVINRYHDKPIALGFIKNFGLKKGAIAASTAHDSHNIIAVGVTDEAICKVVNKIIEHKGGIAVFNEVSLECLPFPIAGLMSDGEGTLVAKRYKQIESIVKALGCTLAAPFMTLSFMSLLVIPELKMSDLGLFDGNTFQLIPLFE